MKKLIARAMRELLGVMKAVYVVVLLHTFVKMYRTIHLKRVNLPKKKKTLILKIKVDCVILMI